MNIWTQEWPMDAGEWYALWVNGRLEAVAQRREPPLRDDFQRVIVPGDKVKVTLAHVYPGPEVKDGVLAGG